MKKVRVDGPAVKLNNNWYFDKETAVISDEEFEKNKKYLKLMENINEDFNDKKENRTISLIIEDESIDINEIEKDLKDFIKNYKKEDLGDNPEGNKLGENSKDEKEELAQLRNEAKELNIRNAHVMSKETLIEKIAEAKKMQE